MYRILVVLVLAGCAPADYIEWHPLEGLALADAAQLHKMPRNALGFAIPGAPCRIWAPPVELILRHELRHCREGRFHK